MNRYREIKTLGKGSFGRAVLVQEISTKKQFVMKIIQTSTMKPQERQEALQEAKILEKLGHPNITAYKESFQDSRFLYIVMEFANGGDLHDLIRAQKMRGQLFEEPQIWEWFLQICLAVKHIHDRRILHRDLKTQNVFMSLENGRKVCKLGDFGVSKILSSTLECAKTAIGTPYYLSPELCNNQGYNNKSDIWALGCILYEMCTLQHTFEAANMKMLIVKILEGKYTPISSKYSQNMKDLVNAMLQKDPKKRPSINSILRLNFIQEKLKAFDQQMLQNELSHTVFHGPGNIFKGFQEQQSDSQQPQNAFRRPQDDPPPIPPAQYPSNPPLSQVKQPALNVRNYEDIQKQQQQLIDRARQQKEEAARKQRLEQIRQQEVEEMRRKQELVEKTRLEYERKKREQEEKQRQIEREQAERRAALLREKQELAQRSKEQHESQWQRQLQAEQPAQPVQVDQQAENRAQYMNRLKRENPRQYLIEVQKRKDEDRLRELQSKQAGGAEKAAVPSKVEPDVRQPVYQAQAVQQKRYDPYAPSEDNPLVVHEESSSDFGDKPDEAFAQANCAQNKTPEQLKRMLQDANSKDSLCYRMETLRSYIEKELGFDKFLSVYEEIQTARESDMELDGTKVRKQLGDDNLGWLNLIVQFLLVERRFNECQ